MASLDVQDRHARQIADLEQFQGHASGNLTTLNTFGNIRGPQIDHLNAFKAHTENRLNHLESFETTTASQLAELKIFQSQADPLFKSFDSFQKSATTKLDEFDQFKKTAEPALKDLEKFRKAAGPRLDSLENARKTFDAFQMKADSRLKELENLKAGERLDNLETAQKTIGTFQTTAINAITNNQKRLDIAEQTLKDIPDLSKRVKVLEDKIKKGLTAPPPPPKPEDGDKNGRPNIHVSNYGQLQVQHSPNCTRTGDASRDSFNTDCSCMNSHNGIHFPPLPAPDFYGGGFLGGILPVPVGIYSPRSPSPGGYRRGNRHRHSHRHTEQAAYAGAVAPSIHLAIESRGKGGLFSGSKKNNLSLLVGGGAAAGHARNGRSHRRAQF